MCQCGGILHLRTDQSPPWPPPGKMKKVSSQRQRNNSASSTRLLDLIIHNEGQAFQKVSQAHAPV